MPTQKSFIQVEISSAHMKEDVTATTIHRRATKQVHNTKVNQLLISLSMPKATLDGKRHLT